MLCTSPSSSRCSASRSTGRVRPSCAALMRNPWRVSGPAMEATAGSRPCRLDIRFYPGAPSCYLPRWTAACPSRFGRARAGMAILWAAPRKCHPLRKRRIWSLVRGSIPHCWMCLNCIQAVLRLAVCYSFHCFPCWMYPTLVVEIKKNTSFI